MSELTTIEPQPVKTVIDPAAIDRRSGKPKQLSKRAKAAIRSVLNGEHKTHKAAAEAFKFNASHLSELIHSPQGQAFVARERSKTISIASMRAAARALELVDADSEHVAAKMVERVLESTGDFKMGAGHSVNVQINNSVAPGYVVDLTPWSPVIEHTSSPDPVCPAEDEAKR